MKTTKKRYPITNPVVFASGLKARPDVAKSLIEVLTHEKIATISEIECEKTLAPSPLEKLIRLDLLVDTVDGKRFNVEMQASNKPDINRRMRYYEARLIQGMLVPGQNYTLLPDTYVIFLCNYDPYKMGLPIYRIHHACHGAPDKAVFDGTKRIVANARAWQDCPVVTGATKSLLQYVATGKIGDDGLTARLDKIVDEMNKDTKMIGSIASVDEHIEWEVQARVAEAVSEAVSEAKAEGIANFGKVIAALSDTARYDDIAKLSKDPSLLSKYASSLGIAI